MKHTSFITASVFLAAFAFSVLPAAAQSRGRAASRGTPSRGAAIGRAVPRTGPVPRIGSRGRIGVVPYYRPYFYPSRFGLGLYGGYGYPFDYYGYYGYPYGFGYPYGYAGFSSFGYGYPGYSGLPPAGYVSAAEGGGYGSVRIESANRDAQVFADGYYVGVVDDFDGTFQRLNLETGAHRIEIRSPNAATISFEVNVQPGQTITYRADPRR